jgi:hypothetical protein
MLRNLIKMATARKKKVTTPAAYVPSALSVFLVLPDEFIRKATDAAFNLRHAPNLSTTIYANPRQWADEGSAEYKFFTDAYGQPAAIALRFVQDEKLGCAVCHGVDGFVAEHGAKAGLFSLSPPKAKRAK